MRIERQQIPEAVLPGMGKGQTGHWPPITKSNDSPQRNGKRELKTAGNCNNLKSSLCNSPP